MAASAGPDINEDGLVLALDAADRNSYPGSGTTWTDLSGNGNNGTLVNGVGYNGSNGGSLSFDGVDDAVENPNFASFIEGNLVGTISSWFKLPSSSYSSSIKVTLFNSHQPPHNPCTLSFNSNNDVTVLGYTTAAIRISDDDGGNSDKTIKAYYDSSNPSKYFDDQWHSVSLVCGSNFNKLYVDGVEVILTYDFGSSSTGNFLFRNNTNIFDISGIRTTGSRGNHFIGQVSSVLVHNRALTASEIQQNFNVTRSRFGI